MTYWLSVIAICGRRHSVEDPFTSAGIRRSIRADTRPTKEPMMQIDIKGRNVPVTDELRMHAERRLGKVRARSQTWPAWRSRSSRSATRGSPTARSPRATLYLKGVTLRATMPRPRCALAEPDGRRARAPGQAPPRQTAPPPRGRTRAAGGRRPVPPPRPVAARVAEPRRRGPATAAAGAAASAAESYPWRMPSLLDRALNVGEAKKFKTTSSASR